MPFLAEIGDVEIREAQGIHAAPHLELLAIHTGVTRRQRVATLDRQEAEELRDVLEEWLR